MFGHFLFQKSSPDRLSRRTISPSDSTFYLLKRKPSEGLDSCLGPPSVILPIRMSAGERIPCSEPSGQWLYPGVYFWSSLAALPGLAMRTVLIQPGFEVRSGDPAL